MVYNCKDLDASIRCSLALVNIVENYPPETWTHLYTDGSATKAITDVGAGIIIQYPSGATQTAISATGEHCTNYRAETEALKQAAILVKDSLEPCSPTVFLTDALCIRSSPNKQVSSPSNTNARTLQHKQSSSPMDPSTLRNPWQRASRSASQMRSTRRATINQHPLPGKDHHNQNSAET